MEMLDKWDLKKLFFGELFGSICHMLLLTPQHNITKPETTASKKHEFSCPWCGPNIIKHLSALHKAALSLLCSQDQMQ